MPNDQMKVSRRKIIASFPLYPVLFGIYPLVALAAYNISQIDISLGYRSLFLSLVLALTLVGILRLLLGDWSRAAFLSLLLLVLFSSYGQIYSLLKSVSFLGIAIGRHRWLAPLWVLLAGLAIWVSTRKSVQLAAAIPWLNLLSALLLVFPLYQIVRFEVVSRMEKSAAAVVAPADAASPSHQPYPDIYYIILDAYGRTDEVKEVYHYDNTAFIDALTKRGFYVATCSQSNYAYTVISLASSLNMDYLDKFPAANDEQTAKLLQANAVRQFLRVQGYTIIAFETGYRFTQWEDANVYYSYQPATNLINDFELLFLQTTLLRLPLDNLKLSEISTQGEIKHNRIIHELEILKKLPNTVRSPKFVFAHFVVPHGPFVFGPNGEVVPPSKLNDPTYKNGYQNSVTFISNAILQAVDQLVANSKTPPIIVIQGDHGGTTWFRPDQRMKILNAYYLPGAGNVLYPSISPVNTFRTIFNTYFNQSYPLLQDVSRYSRPSKQYDYQIIPNVCTP
jgi:hypothetical protein